MNVCYVVWPQKNLPMFQSYIVVLKQLSGGLKHRWIGGKYSNHCIDDNSYHEEKVIESEMAIEGKVCNLTVQNIPVSISTFKIISTRPQSTNETCDQYNNSILHADDDIDNVQCISIVCGGLAG